MSDHNHDLQKYLNRRAQRKGRSMKEEEMHGEARLEDWMQMKEGRGRAKQINGAKQTVSFLSHLAPRGM